VQQWEHFHGMDGNLETVIFSIRDASGNEPILVIGEHVFK
jgi:hypothetical protein